MDYPNFKDKSISNIDFQKELCNKVQDFNNCKDIGCTNCIYTESNIFNFEEWLNLEE